MLVHTSRPLAVFRKGCTIRLALAALVLGIAAGLSAQDYAPFNADFKALYTTSPVAGPASALGFTSVEVIDGDSVFHPVMTFDPTDYNGLIEPDFDNCSLSFWASEGLCHPVNVPLWLGAEIRKTGDAAYRYTTSAGEHLDFDFALAPGDSALVYENEDMELYLIGEGEGTGTFLGIEDALAQFRLAVLDAEGGTVESPLHNAPITLGAQLGAVNFMRIDSFPQILQPLAMAGHAGAEAGFYAVKAADIYDFQEGDIFQYHFQSNYGIPNGTVNFHETRTVASRTDTDTSITYTFNVHRFEIDGSLDSNFVSSQTVSKTEHLAEIPFEEQVHVVLTEFIDLIFYYPYLFRSLRFNNDLCGGGSRYSVITSDYYSCPSDGDCYGNNLHLAPFEWYEFPKEHSYSPGLGEVYRYGGWDYFGTGPSGSETNELIYVNKNGVACGEQVILSTTDYRAGRQLLKLYPNPASDHFRIEMPGGGETLHSVELCDLQGRTVRTWPASQTTYNTDGLPVGLYVVRAGGPEGVFTQKLVIE